MSCSARTTDATGLKIISPEGFLIATTITPQLARTAASSKERSIRYEPPWIVTSSMASDSVSRSDTRSKNSLTAGLFEHRLFRGITDDMAVPGFLEMLPVRLIVLHDDKRVFVLVEFVGDDPTDASETAHDFLVTGE